MISGIESSALYPNLQQLSNQMDVVRSRQIENRANIGGVQEMEPGLQPMRADSTPKADRVTFGSLIGNLVEEVDAKGKTSAQELKKVMTGEVDNLHQSMVAMQEASTSFTLMMEVRNKLMESYQQIMRMQV